MQTYQAATIEKEQKNYFIERLNQNNIKDVAFLHSEVYGVTTDKHFFLKKYQTSYTGVEYIGYLAYTKDFFPVAFYGVIPCYLTYQGDNILAAQSADTMTHPQYRYKGMFVELSNKTFLLCKSADIKILFGFPNQNSYHGAIHKLGWKETEKMNCFKIPVKTIPFEKIFSRLNLKSLYLKYKNFMLRETSSLAVGVENSVIEDGFAGVLRNKDYFIYKSYSPSKSININGTTVWFSIKKIVFIGDMENINSFTFPEVVNRIKSIARKLGITEVQFHCSKETDLNYLFEKFYQPVESYPVLFQDFGSGIPIEKVKFTLADIDIF